MLVAIENLQCPQAVTSFTPMDVAFVGLNLLFNS